MTTHCFFCFSRDLKQTQLKDIPINETKPKTTHKMKFSISPKQKPIPNTSNIRYPYQNPHKFEVPVGIQWAWKTEEEPLSLFGACNQIMNRKSKLSERESHQQKQIRKIYRRERETTMRYRAQSGFDGGASFSDAIFNLSSAIVDAEIMALSVTLCPFGNSQEREEDNLRGHALQFPDRILGVSLIKIGVRESATLKR